MLATADQAQPASADGSDYGERMRVEYRELTARAGRLRDMLQRYADGMLDQADQRDEENNISRMLISKIAQQGE